MRFLLILTALLSVLTVQVSGCGSAQAGPPYYDIVSSGTGTGTGGATYPWVPQEGLTLANNSNPDGYLTGVTEVSPGRYQIDLDYASTARTAAYLGGFWILGGVGVDGSYDTLTEWSGKSSPGMWRRQHRITVHAEPDVLAANNWIASTILLDANKTSFGTGGLTNWFYFRAASGELEASSFGNWGNNAFGPGGKPRATANHTIHEIAFKEPASSEGSYVRQVTHQDGTLAQTSNFDNAFWSTADIDPATRVDVLSFGHYSASAGTSATPLEITIESRLIPIDVDFVGP